MATRLEAKEARQQERVRREAELAKAAGSDRCTTLEEALLNVACNVGGDRPDVAKWIHERLDPPREWIIGKTDVPGLAGPQSRIIAGPALGHREQVRVREVK